MIKITSVLNVPGKLDVLIRWEDGSQHLFECTLIEERNLVKSLARQQRIRSPKEVEV